VSSTVSVRHALVAAVALPLLLAGCAPDEDDEPVVTVVSEPSLRPGDRIPAPRGPVVLTISGDIDVPGGAGAVDLDLETLEAVGLAQYSAFDRQATGEHVNFTGVLLLDLLAVVGATDATTLHAVAINDYTVEIPVEDAHDLPVLVATATDGERMDVEHYGPLRVVYPTEGVELDATVYEPRWIWQLRSIEVR
jgi:hypothetical protein